MDESNLMDVEIIEYVNVHVEKTSYSPASHFDTNTCREHEQIEHAQIALLVPRNFVFRDQAGDDWVDLSVTAAHDVQIEYARKKMVTSRRC